MPVCLSVSVSRLLLSSSSHCVVSTSEKRGTKKEKKKVFHSNPRIFPDLFRLSFPPQSRLPLLSVLTPGSFLLWACGARLTIPAKSYSRGCCQRAAEDCVRATPRVSRWLSLWETPGSSFSPLAPRMCFGICVCLFSHPGQSDEEHINGGPI